MLIDRKIFVKMSFATFLKTACLFKFIRLSCNIIDGAVLAKFVRTLCNRKKLNNISLAYGADSLSVIVIIILKLQLTHLVIIMKFLSGS